MDWYFAKQGRQEGPIDEATLRSRLASGAIARTDLVWREGMAEWTPAGQLPEIEMSSVGGTTATAPLGPSAGLGPSGTPQGGVAPYAGASLTGQAGSPPPPGIMMASVPPTSGLAIASMVCGIVGLLVTMGCLLGGIFGLPAVICGHGALSTMRSSLVPVGGRGMAIAGLVTGYLACLGTLGFIALMMLGFLSAAGGGLP